MSKLTPYLGFDGNCTEALRFYEAALGGKIDMTLTYGESPMAEQCPAEHRNRVMHSVLALPAGGQLFAADRPPGMALSLRLAVHRLLTDRYGIGWMVNAGPSKL